MVWQSGGRKFRGRFGQAPALAGLGCLSNPNPQSPRQKSSPILPLRAVPVPGQPALANPARVPSRMAASNREITLSDFVWPFGVLDSTL